MSPHRGRRRAAVIVAATFLFATANAIASASWNKSVSASQTVASATLVAPTDVAAARDTCVVAVALTVKVTWTAATSTAADGYEIYRKTGSGGSYAAIGTVSGRTTTTYSDVTALFSTTYFYTVASKRGSWRSPMSNAASVTTPSSLCT